MDLSREPIRGGDHPELHENFGRVLRSLSPDKALELKKARAFFAGSGGVDGLMHFYQSINGLNAEEIVARWNASKTKPISSGEVEGVGFTLHQREDHGPNREEKPACDRAREE